MSPKSERGQARDAVAGYHEARLVELVAHVADATDKFRDGELNAFDVDQVLFQSGRGKPWGVKACHQRPRWGATNDGARLRHSAANARQPIAD